MINNIFVVGDACVDWLIYDDSYGPPLTIGTNSTNWQNSWQASLSPSPGGVLLLANFIRKAIPEIKITTYKLNRLTTYSSHRINSIAEIRKFKDKHTGQEISRYRINQFKGFSGSENYVDKLFTKPLKGIGQADLIVIDDAGNGFRDIDHSWLGESSKSKRKPLIIHKVYWPLVDNKLMASIDEHLADQNIVIINASDLRKSGIQLSSKLSWDQTVCDFIKNFKSDARFNPFKNCAHLIIRFGLETVIYAGKQKSKRKKSSVEGYDVRLLYIPELFEGQIQSEISGTMQGMSSIFVTALVQNINGTTNHPEFSISELIEKGVIHGMDAAIKCLQIGYEYSEGKLYCPVKQYLNQDKTKVRSVSLNNFVSAAKDSTSLMRNQVCGGAAGVLYGALELVKSGVARGSMTAVPFVKFGDLTSADRQEIESYRSIRSLLEEYVKNPAGKKPISIGVFGPPGSGKSFGVKQIAGMFGDTFSRLEFNLSQFKSTDELCRAFQEVRDVNLKGKLPLVFFDEFDTSFGDQELGWLKYFLAPMQDGEFREGEKIHPIGRGVFVFAGGTSNTYEGFEMPVAEEKQNEKNTKWKEWLDKRKSLKVPDFLSRLRGFINIKGINRYGDDPDEDAVFMVRRALVLRHHLSQVDGIITRDTKEISIDRDLLRALVTLPELKHGARSLEAIIGMSSLKGTRVFSRSCLPADHLLKMHLDVEKFKKELNMNNEYTLDREFLTAYGKLAHESYLANQKKEGMTIKTNSAMVPWEELSEHDRESNRQQGVDATLKLAAFNYSIRPKTQKNKSFKGLTKQQIETMAIMEHERWMIYKQREGWSYAPGKKDSAAKTNPSLVPWDELPEDEKNKDRLAVSLIPKILDKCGYEIYEL